MPSQNDHEPIFPGFSCPNGTIVPDEFFDVLMTLLSESELRVCLYIMRRTFGFKKQADDISLKQMVEGIMTKDGRRLDNGAGVSKASAVRAVAGLMKKGVIVKRNNRSAERGDEATTYALRFLAAPVSQFETPTRFSGINTPVSHRETHNQQLSQTTDESLSKFERSNDQKFSDDGDSRPQARGAAEGQEIAPDASESTQRLNMPAQPVSRPTSPGNASGETLPEQSVSQEFLVARDAIRSTLTARMSLDGEGRRRSHQQDSPSSLTPPPTVAVSESPRRRGRPSIGTSAERDLVLAYLDDFNRELLHDDAPLASLVTQTINIFRLANIPRECWPAYLYQARTAVKEHAGSITKHSRTNDERKNRGPYYFAVLRALVAAGEE